MIQYIVTGMSCAACSARVEKQFQKYRGNILLSESPYKLYGSRRHGNGTGDH